MESNYQWLKKICQLKDQQWHQEFVLRSDQIENVSYYIDCDIETKFINPRDIVGIHYYGCYNDLNDITWIQLLNSLKRFYRIREDFNCKEKLSEHIIKEYSDEKRVVQYGSKYITVSGQHRMALAKFLELDSIKVGVLGTKFDSQRFDAESKKINFLNYLDSVGIISEQDMRIQSLHLNKFTFFFIRKSVVRIEDSMYDEFKEFYDNLSMRKSSLWNYLGEFYNLEKAEINIYDVQSLKKSKSFFRKIKYTKMT